MRFNITLSALVVALLCCFSGTAYSQPWEVVGKTGAFIPASKNLHKIFHTAMPFFEVEGIYRFSPFWDVWGGVGCIFDQGNSLGCSNTTTLQVIPFTLGFHYIIPVTSNLEFFSGLGGIWSLYRNQDHSPDVHRNISGNGFGAILKVRIQYRVRESIFMSLFAEYMHQRFSFHKVYEEHFTYRNDVNMCGIKLGLGITYDF